MIEIVPRKGTYVTKPTRKDVEEVFELRRILEVYAAQLAVQSMTTAECDALRACADKMTQLAQSGTGPQVQRAYERLDRQFHQRIIDASGSKHLKRLWMQVNAHVRIARIRGRKPEGQLDLSTKEHAEIACAFASRGGARKLLEEHIRRAKESLLGTFEGLDQSGHAA